MRPPSLSYLPLEDAHNNKSQSKQDWELNVRVRPIWASSIRERASETTTKIGSRVDI